MTRTAVAAKQELWLRIHGYEFENLVPPSLKDHLRELFGDNGASLLAFASKVAKKHNWPLAFTLRAIEEYKKYVYLGVTSKYVVSPPKLIDVIWHEHILFTKGYRDFCDDVLHQHFDHHPELVPFDPQTGIMDAQYHKILEYYEREFNTTPPADIWGTPKFSRARQEGSARPRLKSETPTQYGSDPLYSYFTDPTEFTPLHPHTKHHEFTGFGGSGEFGGGGVSRSFEVQETPSHHVHSQGHSHHHTDTPSHSDMGGHSSSDSGSHGGGDSSGASCGGSGGGCSSGGCGGGGCGGD
jgi:hypothetical protein